MRIYFITKSSSFLGKLFFDVFLNMNLLPGTLSYVELFVHGVMPEICCYSANIS